MSDGRGGPRPGPPFDKLRDHPFDKLRDPLRYISNYLKEIRNTQGPFRNSKSGIRNPFEEILLLYSETIIFV